MIAIGSAIACAVVGAACSSFSSDQSPSGDAEAGVGAGADTSVPGSDGGPDAAILDGSADARPFCMDVDAQFCWSFDDIDRPLTGPTLTPRITAGSTPPTVDNDPGAAASPPGAMLASLSDVGAQGLYLDTVQNVTFLNCAMKAYLDVTTTEVGVEVAITQFDYDGSFFNVPQVQVVNQVGNIPRARLEFNGMAADLGNVPSRAWTDLFFETSLVSGHWLLHAGIAGNKDQQLDLGMLGALPHFDKIFFGIATGGPAPVAWKVRYDNIVCRWQ